ncbi:MAG: RDD family protein [Acidobacteriia bacterium]|nr:RDD family protein [Terriglobia bacterium]
MDKLIIDTPEQVHLEFVLAGLGSRFMAVLLDSVIQFLIYLALFIIVVVAMSGTPTLANYPLWVGALVIFIIFCVYWGYYALFEIFWKGQTPGKRWAGIRVIKDSGRPIHAFEAIARNLLRIVDWFPGFYGVGVVTMFLNSRNRRLGDFVAGTLVVHETSEIESQIFFNHQENVGYALPQAAQLTLQEADLIEAFLARRLDIPAALRASNAQRIAQMISARLAIAPEARPGGDEHFLELLLREFRSRARYR